MPVALMNRVRKDVSLTDMRIPISVTAHPLASELCPMPKEGSMMAGVVAHSHLSSFTVRVRNNRESTATVELEGKRRAACRDHIQALHWQ